MKRLSSFVITLANPLVEDWDAMRRHRLSKGQFTLGGIVPVASALDKPDSLVTEADQVLRHRARAVVIVDIHVTDCLTAKGAAYDNQWHLQIDKGPGKSLISPRRDGTGTTTTPPPGGTNPGKLYVTNEANNTILRFDNALTATGDQTPAATLNNTSQISSPQYLLIDSASNRLYVAVTNAVLVYDNASTQTGGAAASRASTSSCAYPPIRLVAYPSATVVEFASLPSAITWMHTCSIPGASASD